MKLTIGEYLLKRLKEIGVAHIIGVPGDYNLQFLEQIEYETDITFVGTCNELNAAYAAEGYSRQKGISAVLTTYGVGELSAICGVAGAAAEHVPVVCLNGAPPLYAAEQHYLMHHTLADGNFDNMMACYQQFTVAQTRLTPINAASEIDRVLTACVLQKRPVYIQIPSDVSFIDIEVTMKPLVLTLPASDAVELKRALDHALSILKNATAPVMLIDMDAQRHQLAQALAQLSKQQHIPYASLSTGKAILNENNPFFMGIYNGANTQPAVKAAFESADCVITTSPRFIEINSGLYTQKLPVEQTINIDQYSVTIGQTVYYSVNAHDFLADLLLAKLPVYTTSVPEQVAVSTLSAPSEEPLTQAQLWQRAPVLFQDNDVVFAESGTSSIGLTNIRMPDNVQYVSAAIWGSIGYTLPGLLGSMIAAPERRHILFIGDGSFQLTAQELSTILNLGYKPIIFLLNNRGYTIERFILGMKSVYNDVANWQYAKLPGVFAEDKSFYTAEVHNEKELLAVFEQAKTTQMAMFVEVHLDPFDAPLGLQKFGPKAAEFDYGPRGPQ